MDRGGWPATAHGMTKSLDTLNYYHKDTHTDSFSTTGQAQSFNVFYSHFTFSLKEHLFSILVWENSMGQRSLVGPAIAFAKLVCYNSATNQQQ